MSAVDLTKCQPGDLLKLRSGSGVYLREIKNDAYPHLIHSDHSCEIAVTREGMCFDTGEECDADVIAIIHPTRAELEEQRRELLGALKLANECGVACGMDIAYPDAHREIRFAIARVEATNG